MSRGWLLLLSLGLFGFKHGPQVQNVTVDQAWFTWESEGAATFELRGPERAETLTPKAPPGEMIKLKIDGLKPARRYTYTLKDDHGSAQGYFQTPPPPGFPFTFAIYGDNRSDHRAHAAVVKALAAIEPDLALNTGDLVARGGRLDEWGIFFRISKPIMEIAPLYPILGNHDLDGAGQPAYFMRFFALPQPRTYYAFSWGNVRFLGLDTEVQISDGHGMDAAQLAWALAEVKRAEADPQIDHIIAFAHQGPFSGNPRRHGNLAFQPQLRALRAEGLDLIASGHDHFYERGVAPDGLVYMVVGGGGAPLYATKGPGDYGDHVALSSRTIYSVVRARVAGPVMHLCAVDIKSQPFDCFSLSAAAAPAASSTPPPSPPPAPSPTPPTPAPR
ncbi:metallophosphoesterase [Myxococcota bacterium]|nr:metallophosphoesterase [Myxococcota bacterium]MBU1431312.1 metallophosphoesterase [Myxococcota bacterium]MBU1898924.1 metallophosphoesterase [Myxococcota bacterium]